MDLFNGIYNYPGTFPQQRLNSSFTLTKQKAIKCGFYKPGTLSGQTMHFKTATGYALAMLLNAEQPLTPLHIFDGQSGNMRVLTVKLSSTFLTNTQHRIRWRVHCEIRKVRGLRETTLNKATTTLFNSKQNIITNNF